MLSNPPTIHHPKLRRIMSVCVLSLWHAPVEAANYYVATTGSNSNAGTSLASPFLTIQQAANVAQAGDNVYVRGGTYRETVTVPHSGTASAPDHLPALSKRAGHDHRTGPTQQRLDAIQRLHLAEQQRDGGQPGLPRRPGDDRGPIDQFRV